MTSRGARLPKGPKKVSRRVRHQGGPLATLVGFLNDLPKMSGEERTAWEEAAAIVGEILPAPDTTNPRGAMGHGTLLGSAKPLPWKLRQEARFTGLGLRLFRAMAQRAGVMLDVSVEARSPSARPRLQPRVKPRDLRGLAAIVVWEAFPHIARLRRCDQCPKWFEDLSDSGNKRFCGRECSARWWTRGRRRLAAATVDRRANRRKP